MLKKHAVSSNHLKKICYVSNNYFKVLASSTKWH